eukprot:767230-Hanusia_phi.AAC.13
MAQDPERVLSRHDCVRDGLKMAQVSCATEWPPIMQTPRTLQLNLIASSKIQDANSWGMSVLAKMSA